LNGGHHADTDRAALTEDQPKQLLDLSFHLPVGVGGQGGDLVRDQQVP